MSSLSKPYCAVSPATGPAVRTRGERNAAVAEQRARIGRDEFRRGQDATHRCRQAGPVGRRDVGRSVPSDGGSHEADAVKKVAAERRRTRSSGRPDPLCVLTPDSYRRRQNWCEHGWEARAAAGGRQSRSAGGSPRRGASQLPGHPDPPHRAAARASILPCRSRISRQGSQVRSTNLSTRSATLATTS
jgi:hypothetical protein